MKVTFKQSMSIFTKITLAGGFGLISLSVLYFVVELVTPLIETAAEHEKNGELDKWVSANFPSIEYLAKFLFAIFFLIIPLTVLGLFSGVFSKVITGLAHDELKDILKNQ